MLMIVYLTN